MPSSPTWTARPSPAATSRCSAVRLEWTYVQGEWQEQERDEQVCTVVSALEPQRCTFQTPEGGTYRITATVYDDLERAQHHADHALGERRPAAQGQPRGAGRGAADPRPRRIPARRHGRDPGAGALCPGGGAADAAPQRPGPQPSAFTWTRAPRCCACPSTRPYPQCERAGGPGGRRAAAERAGRAG